MVCVVVAKGGGAYGETHMSTAKRRRNCWTSCVAASPSGKKHARNIYAHSLEECEEKLAEMILTVKAEIAAAKGYSALSS